MKRISPQLGLLLILILTTHSLSFAQISDDKGQIGIHYTPFTSNILLGPSRTLEGAANHDIVHGTGFGINYVKRINKTLAWESGLDYTLFKVQTNSMAIPPHIPRDTTYSSLSLIQIPITVRAYFANDIIFLTGGALLDFDMNLSSPISNQTGIGLMAGLGLNYDFKFGLSVYANPYIKAHSLVPFGSWERHERVLESGIKFGVMYRL